MNKPTLKAATKYNKKKSTKKTLLPPPLNSPLYHIYFYTLSWSSNLIDSIHNPSDNQTQAKHTKYRKKVYSQLKRKKIKNYNCKQIKLAIKHLFLFKVQETLIVDNKLDGKCLLLNQTDFSILIILKA